jgi:photosystem II stability/assembly factor-like uncharacterized protein
MMRIHRGPGVCAALLRAPSGCASVAAVCAAFLVAAGCKVEPCPPEYMCGVVATGGGGGEPGQPDGAPPSSGGAPGSPDTGPPPPVPHGEWKNVTNNLANLSSECGTLSIVSAKPDEDLLITGISLNGLFSSKDGGNSWQPLGKGPKSDTIINRPWVIVYDPVNLGVFWEAGGYNDGGVFKTTDSGTTLLHQGNSAHNDEVSVDFTDPDRKTLLAGGHEAPNSLFRSTDGGATWVNIGPNLPKESCTNPAVIDAKTHLVGCAGIVSGIVGIFRTTDGGKTWVQVSELGGGGRTHLEAKDGSLYWLNAKNSGLARSTDQGQTWMQVADGLATPPIELPDGRLAAVTGDHISLSKDQGENWRAVTTPFPVGVSGLTYSRQQKAYYVWHEICGTAPVPVPTDSIFRYEFDYETE